MKYWQQLSAAAFVIGLFVSAGPASAQTLGPVVYSHATAPSLAESATSSDLSIPALAGNSFTLGSATTLAGIRWWGGYDTEIQTDNFSVRIHAVTAGTPSQSPLHTFAVGAPAFKTVDGEIEGYSTQYRYEASLASTTLGAGTYLMSIVNNSGANPDWGWTKASETGPRWFAIQDGGEWFSLNGKNAWEITGAAPEGSAVPEPGALALFLPALGLMALVRRRRAAAGPPHG